MDFGWSLADVLKKSRENVKNNDQDKDKKGTGGKVELASIEETEEEPELKEKSGNEVLMEEEKKLSSDWMEIGTWSNDMANHDPITVCITLHTFYEYISVTVIAGELKGMVLAAVGTDTQNTSPFFSNFTITPEVSM